MKEKNNKQFWERVAGLYAPLMEKDSSFYETICAEIRPYLNRHMDVLELACGTGQLSFPLSPYTKTWLATDFSEKMILEARKRGEKEKLSFDVADATALSFPERKFDCVVIANALHIMPHPEQAMREVDRVLKRGGLLCAPTFLWKEGKANRMVKMFMSILGFKMYGEWNKTQFRDFVQQYGFRVEEIHLVPGALAPVGVLIAYKKDIGQ